MEEKNYFGIFLGYTSWSPILYRFWEQILMFFSLFFGCFLGVSFTCVAFRVNFAKVRFTDVKRGFASIYDDEVLMIFVNFL